MKGLRSLLGTGYGPLRSSPKGYRTIYKLNRSRNRRPFRTYEEARRYAIQRGFTARPVWGICK